MFESLAEYIARDSEFYARAVVDKIVDSARKLKDFPFAGRIVPEFQDESVRERFVYSYRLIDERAGGQIVAASAGSIIQRRGRNMSGIAMA